MADASAGSNAGDGAMKGNTPLVDALRKLANDRACASCVAGDHADDAAFCRRCGARLD